jgi:hypothetical protein
MMNGVQLWCRFLLRPSPTTTTPTPRPRFLRLPVHWVEVFARDLIHQPQAQTDFLCCAPAAVAIPLLLLVATITALLLFDFLYAQNFHPHSLPRLWRCSRVRELAHVREAVSAARNGFQLDEGSIGLHASHHPTVHSKHFKGPLRLLLLVVVLMLLFTLLMMLLLPVTLMPSPAVSISISTIIISIARPAVS